MKRFVRRAADTQPGRYVVQLLAPMLARPSRFRGGSFDVLYGKVRTAPLTVPLVPAAVAAVALGINASTTAQQIPWDVQTQAEAIKNSLNFVSNTRIYTPISVFIMIHIIAGMRWMWHFGMSRLVDKLRRDGLKNDRAPWPFFVIHTSGCVLWMNVLLLVVVLVGAAHPGRQFSVIHEFLYNHMLIWAAFAMGTLFVLYSMWEGYKEAMIEIYKTEAWARRVRYATYAPFILLAFGPLVIDVISRFV